MKKNNFTVSEIVIAIVIIGILVTIGIPLYSNIIENARAKTCELNLKTILGAVEAQTLEQNSFPASLSKISDKNFNKAWAKVLKEEGAFKVKLAYFLANFDEGGLAFAASATTGPWVHKFISDSSALSYPSVHGGNSYGINSALTGKTYEQYKTEADSVLVVGDSNSNTFSGNALAERHKKYGFFEVTTYAIGANNRHKKKKIKGGVPLDDDQE